MYAKCAVYFGNSSCPYNDDDGDDDDNDDDDDDDNDHSGNVVHNKDFKTNQLLKHTRNLRMTYDDHKIACCSMIFFHRRRSMCPR